MSNVLDRPGKELKKQKKMTIPLAKPSAKEEKRAIHFFLKGEGVNRLDYLISKIHPHNQTGVIAKSIQLFYLIFLEHENDSEFYIKRKGQKIEKYDLFT